MNKNQRVILIIILSFIFLFIITSIISYHENIIYHKIDSDYYIVVKTAAIQPFYNILALKIWAFGFIIIGTFTYFGFQKTNEHQAKTIPVNFKTLLKIGFIYMAIFYGLGIFGEFSPSFFIGDKEIYLISESEFKKNTNINDGIFKEFDNKYWIEI